MNEKIPPAVAKILALLRQAGFAAFPVGGGVRDILRGEQPHDWDVTTAATVEEMRLVFKDLQTLEVGAQHGTVVVAAAPDFAVEVTTFRQESGYSDGRHPDAVTFSRRLNDDLARRDFTINALCLDENGAVIDLFGGQQDLHRRVLRAIGDPFLRFEEDALRILRALRLSAQLGFEIEPQTQRAMRQMRGRLALLSAERVFAELTKLLVAKDVVRVLLQFPEVLFEVVPQLGAQAGVFQRQDYHCYDVYEHTIRSVGFVPPTVRLRLAMLLHDIGKPECADGNGHFKGHAKAGEKRAKEALDRLRCPKALRDTVVALVGLHAIEFVCDERLLKRQLVTHGKERLFDLLEVCRADNMAKRPEVAAARSQNFDKVALLLDGILAQNPPLSVAELAVDGHDLAAAGIPQGPQMGKILQLLLLQVTDQVCKNNKTDLLAAAKQLWQEKMLNKV